MGKYFRHPKLLLYITTIQEAFGAVIPYFFLLSTITLLLTILEYFQVDLLWIDRTFVEQIQKGLALFSSLVISISIAHYAAVRLKIPHVIVGALTVAVYITISTIEQADMLMFLMPGFSAAVIYAPVASSFVMHLLYPYLSLRLPLSDANRHIYRLFNYLLVFLAAYVVVMALYYGIDWLLDWWLDDLGAFLEASVPTSAYLFIRDALVQIFWFFGIHGEHTVGLFFPYGIFREALVPHLSYLEFNRLFVTIGGSGAGLALLIAALLLARTRTHKIIARISIPFVLFNINTLLIFAFVVLNRYLFLPFVAVPLLNLLLAYGFVHWMPVSFTGTPVLWNTPVFVDGYLKTGGDVTVILFQLFLLLVDTLIYYRAMKRFIETQSLPRQLAVLSEKLNIHEEIASRSHIGAYQAYTEIIDANAELDTVLKNLNENKMLIYYQPKIDTHNHRCNQFEALIRYWNDGRLVGPVFLDTIEKAGMAPVIDLWVVQQVRHDLDRWREREYVPQISINLHPDTLGNPNVIEKITEIMGDHVVTFEIVERSFLHQKDAFESLNILQTHRHRVSIDDFGLGYSNLGILLENRIDELKLDRTLVQKLDQQKGKAICRNITRFCHEIGIRVVAEGVETGEQKRAVTAIGIDTIQGWYYSPAIPFEKVRQYALHFGKKGSGPEPE